MAVRGDRYVGLNGYDPAAHVLDLAADRFGLLGVRLVVHRHRGPNLRQGDGGSTADPAAGSGDQGDLVFEQFEVRCHALHLASVGGISGNFSHASPMSRFMWLLTPTGILASALPL